MLLAVQAAGDRAQASQSQAAVTSAVFSTTSALRDGAEAARAHAGEHLADTATICFCLKTSLTRVHLLQICTPVSRDMVLAVYKRSADRSKTFHLMNFDECPITAREAAVYANQAMDDEAQSAADNLAPLLLQKGPQGIQRYKVPLE